MKEPRLSSPSPYSPHLITIVIADDHPVVREGLFGMLSGQPDFVVVGEASDGVEAIALCEQHTPNVALIDLEMPLLNGIAAIRRLVESGSVCRPIILTTYDSDRDIAHALAAGAYGYLLKDAPRADLFAAIRTVAAGERLPLPQRTRAETSAILSAREIEVLELVAKGMSNVEIGRYLHISKATVKTHLVHVFRKLNAVDRTSAVTAAIERKIIRIATKQ